MKIAFIVLILICPVLVFAQNTEKNNSLAYTDMKPMDEDSLTVKRKILTTLIYRKGIKLSPEMIRTLYSENKNARRSYLSGQILKPLGPLLSASGVVLGYIAIKGKPASANIHYNNQDITAHYTIRSRPKLAAGLGMFIAGIVMLESGNELIVRSSRQYNSKIGSQKTTSFQPSFHFGITHSGNLGVYARF
ncbi:hypothetical protein [Dyadobacter helix]|nr:hypothetical protein [Dyadobacter sp. CECT 9275]